MTEVIMGNVLELYISKSKEAEREPLPEAVFVSSEGVEGDDLNRGRTHAVSLLAKESRDRIAAIGIEGLCTRRFYANIVTEGVSLFDMPLGTRFKIGDARFAVTQVGKPCFKDCDIYRSAYDCVLHKEAVFADILEGSTVHVGDEIIIE